MSRLETSNTLQQTQGYYLSHMTEHDLLEVVEIEEASGLSRWGWEAYHAELAQGSNVLMFVALGQDGATGQSSGRSVRGFIASRLIANELHVNNVAVRDEDRRQGIGQALLERVIAEGRRLGAQLAFLEVRAGNKIAQSLYARCGFKRRGIRRNYYSDPVEDALVMSRTI